MPSAEYMRAWRESHGPCGIEGCDGLYMALGYCQAHYKRFKKYGDPLGKAAPRAKKRPEKKATRAPKYKLCEEHKGYMAGCPMCQAGARMRPVNLERRRSREGGRDRSGESKLRTAESRAVAREKWKTRTGSVQAVNRWKKPTRDELELIFSDLPALSVAHMTGRSVSSIYNARHRRRRGMPVYAFGANRWTQEEDRLLLSLPNKLAAEALGRTYEAVKFRRSLLRRKGAS